jgi:hypothetical protein
VPGRSSPSSVATLQVTGPIPTRAGFELSRSVDLFGRSLPLAGLRRVDLDGMSGVVQVIFSVSEEDFLRKLAD